MVGCCVHGCFLRCWRWGIQPATCSPAGFGIVSERVGVCPSTSIIQRNFGHISGFKSPEWNYIEIYSPENWHGIFKKKAPNSKGNTSTKSSMELGSIPIGSMYGMFTYIYHKNKPNVGIYTIHGSYAGYYFSQGSIHMFKRAPCGLPRNTVGFTITWIPRARLTSRRHRKPSIGNWFWYDFLDHQNKSHPKKKQK